MRFTVNPSTGQSLYLQLTQQIRHAIETGVLQPGDALPGIRTLAAELVVSPNTVIKAYNELEHAGLIELRHGSGAFVAERQPSAHATQRMRHARDRVQALVDRLLDDHFSEAEIQRLVEAALFYRDPAHARR